MEGRGGAGLGGEVRDAEDEHGRTSYYSGRVAEWIKAQTDHRINVLDFVRAPEP